MILVQFTLPEYKIIYLLNIFWNLWLPLSPLISEIGNRKKINRDYDYDYFQKSNRDYFYDYDYFLFQNRDYDYDYDYLFFQNRDYDYFYDCQSKT